MNATLLGKFLRILGGLLRRRVESMVASQSDSSPSPALVDDLYRVLVEHRRLAYQATLLHLQEEALKASRSVLGAPRAAWAPPEPGYSRDAVRELIRRAPGGLSSPSGVARAAERHLYAASRQTVAASADPRSPGSVVESVEEFLGRLEGFPEPIRREIERDVREQASNATSDRMSQAEAEEWLGSLEGLDEATKERLIRDLERALGASQDDDLSDPVLQSLIDRVQRARDAVLASRVLDSASDRSRVVETARAAVEAASADTPPRGALSDPGHPYWRTDAKGRRIVRPWAWARVVQPSKNGPCGFCATLASRGPVYRTSYTAGGRADRFHNHCRCLVVPVYTSRRWIGKAAQQRYAQVYAEASKSGEKGRDLLNLIDRMLREGRKTKETK